MYYRSFQFEYFVAKKKFTQYFNVKYEKYFVLFKAPEEIKLHYFYTKRYVSESIVILILNVYKK